MRALAFMNALQPEVSMRCTLLATLSAILFGAAAPVNAQPLTTRAADPADVATLDGIIAAFYDIVSGPAGERRDWARDSTLYTADVRFTIEAAAGTGAAGRWRTIDHGTYARQSSAFLEGGFFEAEIHRVTHEFAGMAHVFSTYEWTAPTETGPQRGRGINSIELVFDQGRWWITFAQWASETPERPIPGAYLPPGRR
jgi:hypothetical protein